MQSGKENGNNKFKMLLIKKEEMYMSMLGPRIVSKCLQTIMSRMIEEYFGEMS